MNLIKCMNYQNYDFFLLSEFELVLTAELRGFIPRSLEMISNFRT